MAKTSGLGDNFYVGGYDLSGDINSLSKISGTLATIDVTAINESGMERLGGKRDGAVDFTAYFNPTGAHPVLSALPTSDVQASYRRGTVLGNPAAEIVARQLNYDPTRGADGALTVACSLSGDGFGLEWGIQLTPGLRTDTAATNGTSVDQANGLATPAVPASGTPQANTSPLPVQVVISGGTMTAVVINGVTVGAGAGTYTLPAGQSITLTYTVAPTWTWAAQTTYGAQAYLQVTAFTGTDMTVQIQDSADGVTFAPVTGLTFTQTTSAPGVQRIATASTATLRRYVRAATTTVGGFTSATFAVTLVRNQVAVVF
ncbi:hypothetical protein ABH930_000331 [Kitasatospora sp. GAS204A]|uniref:hypothetical protein n=1 Tax=unclassified Kitasatospora TaxID=2633591 RepID=UPI00247627EF|nr:hypothetical protein [Kitasatospora sp. GAS204B]MDH6116912.1 hypothetical protein [Kitasatospora sp. GAS204B]